MVDFHALRHTFVTNLARGKVHPKIAQALARHSTIALTMDRYTHTDLGEQADALKVLSSLLAAHGTMPVVLASCLASKHAKQRTQADSDRLSDKVAYDNEEPSEVLEKQGEQREIRATGVYRNRTDWGRCSHPPQVLKTWAGTSRANTPKGRGALFSGGSDAYRPSGWGNLTPFEPTMPRQPPTPQEGGRRLGVLVHQDRRRNVSGPRGRGQPPGREEALRRSPRQGTGRRGQPQAGRPDRGRTV